MIESFADSALESFYYYGPGPQSRSMPASIHAVLRRKLDQLHHAHALNDLRVPPANRLEALKGDLRGFFSIRVNDQWRIVFKWHDDQAVEVSLMDYH